MQSQSLIDYSTHLSDFFYQHYQGLIFVFKLSFHSEECKTSRHTKLT